MATYTKTLKAGDDDAAKFEERYQFLWSKSGEKIGQALRAAHKTMASRSNSDCKGFEHNVIFGVMREDETQATSGWRPCYGSLPNFYQEGDRALWFAHHTKALKPSIGPNPEDFDKMKKAYLMWVMRPGVKNPWTGVVKNNPAWEDNTVGHIQLDLTVPGNYFFNFITAIRMYWEYPQVVWKWYCLINEGVDPAVAYQAAWLFTNNASMPWDQYQGYKLSTSDYGHCPLNARSQSKEAAENFINRKPVHLSSAFSAEPNSVWPCNIVWGPHGYDSKSGLTYVDFLQKQYADLVEGNFNEISMDELLEICDAETTRVRPKPKPEPEPRVRVPRNRFAGANPAPVPEEPAGARLPVWANFNAPGQVIVGQAPALDPRWDFRDVRPEANPAAEIIFDDPVFGEPPNF